MDQSKPTVDVLLVDDHKIVRDGLVFLLERHPDIRVVGHAEDGRQALEQVRALHPDIVVMDVSMPQVSGAEATRLILAEDPEARIVALSMHSDLSYVSLMLEAGARGYVHKDEAYEELPDAIRRICAGEDYVTDRISRSGYRAVEGPQDSDTCDAPRAPAAALLCEVVEMRDPYTANHQRRVADLAAAIARDMGLTTLEVDEIQDAALMHDVGKLSVPGEILSKPGALSATEMALVREHAQAGYLVLESGKVDESLAEIVHQHHERVDGSGYPCGLTGENIHLGARILAVADVVEAMISHRPYRPGLGIETALQEVENGSGTLYDERVSAVCIRLFREEGFRFRHEERVYS